MNSVKEKYEKFKELISEMFNKDEEFKRTHKREHLISYESSNKDTPSRIESKIDHGKESLMAILIVGVIFLILALIIYIMYKNFVS
jgi:hypothetical protein